MPSSVAASESAVPGPRCPRCDAALTADAPAGLCPACLVSAHFGTEADLSQPAAGSAPPPPVEEIAPHFPQLEILSCLGRGGMGVVYKARQKSLDRLVALKLLAPERGSDPAFAARFAREAQALARLDHPHIVTIYDFGQAGGWCYLLMEFVDGATLRHLIHGGRIAAREALAIVPQICDALQFAHDHGVVHRDIKPENILLDRRGHAKVADFGLAKLVDPSGDSTATHDIGAAAGTAVNADLTEAGKVMGTPRYMAPEQREHPDAVDHRADIYALGVVLYQMLTGELPDEKQLRPPSRHVRLDVRLDEIVLRALETDPALRYASAADFKTRLETVSAGNIPGDGAAAASPPPVSTPPKIDAKPPDRVAAERVNAPSLAMTVIGVANLVFLFFALCALGLVLALVGGGASIGTAGLLSSSSMRFFGAPLAVAGFFSVIMVTVVASWMLLHFAAFIYIIVASRRMRELRRYRSVGFGVGLLIASGALGLLLCAASPTLFLTACWSLAELGVGIWAWLVLRRPEVKAAFDQNPAPSPSPAHDAAATASPATTSREVEPPAPARRIAGPAAGLMIAAGLQILMLGALAWFYITGVTFRHEDGKDVLNVSVLFFKHDTSSSPGSGVPPVWYSLAPVVLVGGLVLSTLIFVAALRMRRLRGRRLALLGALLALFTAQGLGLGVLFGFWALVILLHREVHAAFDDGAPGKRRLGGLLFATVGAAALLGLFAGAIVATVMDHHDARHAASRALLEGSRAGPLPPLPASPGSPGFAFGPVQDRVLPIGDQTHETGLFDLERGELVLPADVPLPERSVEKPGPVGVVFGFEPGSDKLTIKGVGGVALRPIGPSQWDQFDRAEAYDEILAQEASPGSLVTIGIEQIPNAFLFKTRNGAVGLFRVARGDSSSRSALLRWKFFQIAPAAAPEAPPPETPPSGEIPRDVIDLAPFWTRSFPPNPSDREFGLRALAGRHEFGGLPFEIGGQVVLGSKGMDNSPGTAFPPEVSIPVGRTFDELHLLHAAFWQDAVGAEVATVRIHYLDGETRSFALRYGVHVLDWQRLPGEVAEPLSDPASAVVWRGQGAPGQNATARVIATTIINPRPEAPVASLELVSGHSRAAYALVAATLAASNPSRAPLASLPTVPDPGARPAELRVRVVDKQTGEPLAGVYLAPFGDFDGVNTIAPPILTDAAGVARLPYDPAGTRSMGFSTVFAGYADAGWTSPTSLPAECLVRLNRTAPPSVAIEPSSPAPEALDLSALVARQHEQLAALVSRWMQAGKVPRNGNSIGRNELASLVDTCAELARRGACPGFLAALPPANLPTRSIDEEFAGQLFPLRPWKEVPASRLEDALALSLHLLGQSALEAKSDGSAPFPYVRQAGLAALELFARSGWSPPPPESAESINTRKRDLLARLEAASSIANATFRDQVLQKLATECARAAAPDITTMVLAKIGNMTSRDQAAYTAALELKRQGLRDSANELARTVANATVRERLLGELAQ